MKIRKINEIIIHCTATEYFLPVTKTDLFQWHVVERCFNDIGYHYVIDQNGIIIKCRPLNISGAHCKGHNKNSIGICYVGGLKDGISCDTRTIPQKETLNKLIEDLCNSFPITKISGHNMYSNKACPCFDAQTEYSHLIKKLL